MFNDTEYTLIIRYNRISQQLTKYAGLSLYILCLFGTMMNMLTFIRRTYHSRSCSLYISAASIFDFVQLNLGPLTNILQYGFHYDWTIYSIVFCKIKSYVSFASSVMSATLITTASIDRYLLSSRDVNRWKYCTRSIAFRWIKCVILFWIIVSIPILFCYTCFNHSSHNDQMICSNSLQNLVCLIIQIVYNCFLNGCCPPLLMMLFGFLALTNIYRVRQQSRVRSARLEQINYQLTNMLILQTLKSSFTSFPLSIYNFYLLLTRNMSKTLLYQAQENLIYQVVYLLFWSNYTSFFIYMCSSDIFRMQWKRAIRRVFCCQWRINQHQRIRRLRSKGLAMELSMQLNWFVEILTIRWPFIMTVKHNKIHVTVFVKIYVELFLFQHECIYSSNKHVMWCVVLWLCSIEFFWTKAEVQTMIVHLHMCSFKLNTACEQNRLWSVELVSSSRIKARRCTNTWVNFIHR
jgi:hypothetical protein